MRKTEPRRKTFARYDSAYPYEVLNTLLLHAAQKNLTKLEHQVYLVLLRYTLGYKTDSTYIGYGFIAACAGISDRFNVRRAISGLIKKEMIERKHHYDKAGYTEDRNRYTLILPERLVNEIPRFKGPDEVLGVVSTDHRGDGVGVVSTDHRGVVAKDHRVWSEQTTLNSIKENNKEIKESGGAAASDEPLRGLDRFPTFWTAYPNSHSWTRHKTVTKEIFDALEPQDQDTAIRALEAYKATPGVKNGYIQRPDNFLSNPEFFKSLASESARPAPGMTPEQIEAWRREAAGPPAGWLKQITGEGEA
jgi:hypothetical protein